MLVSTGLTTLLLQSTDPSIQYLTRTRLLGEDPNSIELQSIREGIRTSPRVQALLAECGADGRIPYPADLPWQGSHWVLGCLAELGYPAGDRRLEPLSEQVYEWLFSEAHERNIHKNAAAVRRDKRIRACASMEGFALYYLLTLGLADQRADRLADRLIKWQWPEGGWNCVEDSANIHWMFAESLSALRGLSLYAQVSGSRKAAQSVKRAAEMFLSHNLFEVLPLPGVQADALLLHYPSYSRYDVLSALQVIAEGGWISDPRCRPALDWLERKQTTEGGYPLEKPLYQTRDSHRSAYSTVDWGPTGRKSANPFVTIQAVGVLQAAGIAWLEPV